MGRDEEVRAPRILDVCCGGKMMWLDRKNPLAVFGDLRRGIVSMRDRSHGKADGVRKLDISPSVQLDFRELPFREASFDLVVFDPPHLLRAGPRSWMAAKYGCLGADWRDDLSRGFREALRVLRTGGVLIFKWNDTHVRVAEILALAPQTPVFGHPSGRKGLTHWLTFLKT